MEYTYTEKTLDNQYSFIERVDENGIISCIPIEPANSDYQQYLKWVEENNDQNQRYS